MTEQRPPLPPFTRDSAIQKSAPLKMAGTAAMPKSRAGLYRR
jgi:nuclear transport factor 2 (NTF2) superfamily protein